MASPKPGPVSVSSVLGSQLALSESSSDEEAGPSSRPPKNIESQPSLTPSLPVSKPTIRRLTTEEEEPNQAQIESRLALLARHSAPDAASLPWQESKCGPDASSSDKLPEPHDISPAKYAQEVAEALAMGGETRASESDEADEDELPDAETEATEVNREPPGNIEITLAVPETKRKRKAFDMEAYVRREINRAKKETQVWMHQTHILCLMAQMRFLNRCVDDPLLLGILLSVIPATYAVPHAQLSLIKLSQCVEWFPTLFRFQEDFKRSMDFPHPYVGHLMSLVEKGIYTCNEELVLLFLALTRTLKWPSRLILNLIPVGLKPEATMKGIKREKEEEEEKEEVTKSPTKTKTKTKRRKVEESGSDQEESPSKGAKSKTKGQQRKGDDTASEAEEDAKEVAKSKKSKSKKVEPSEMAKTKSSSKQKIDRNLEVKTNLKAKPKGRGESKASLSSKSKSVGEDVRSNSRNKEKNIEKPPAKRSRISGENQSKAKSKTTEDEKSNSKNMNNNNNEMVTSNKRRSRSLQDPEQSKSKSRSSSKNDQESKTRSRSSSKKDVKLASKTSQEQEGSHQSRARSSSTRMKDKTSSHSPKESPKKSTPNTKNTSTRTSSRRSSHVIKYQEKSETDDDQEEEKSKKSKAATKSFKLSGKAKEEAKIRQASRKSANSSFKIKSEGSDSESDFSSMTQRPKKKARPILPAPAPTKKCSSKAGNNSKFAKFQPVNFWLEVLVDNKWECVDITRKKIGCTKDMEERSSKPMAYVFACDPKGRLKDVTKKYAKEFMTKNRKLRIDETWLTQTLQPWAPPKDALDDFENQQIEQAMQSMPIPTTVSAFKDHPLYVLPRHLLKYEAIYPPNPIPLGYLKGEPIYARECVHRLNGRTNWLKEGRIVRIGEESYKTVKGGPKWDKMTSSIVKGPPLELFGKWQTEIYVPPPAVDGKVPRNEYGNVELFQPWMLPKGTVHIPINGKNFFK